MGALLPAPHDPRFVEDSKVPGDAGLVNIDATEDIAHASLAAPQRFDNSPPSRVGDRLEEGVNLHYCVYTQS
jgi:hypothetical protein